MKDLAVGSAGHNKSVEILVLAEGLEAYEHVSQIIGSTTADLAAEIPKELLDLASHGIDLKGLKSWDKQNLKNLTANLWCMSSMLRTLLVNLQVQQKNMLCNKEPLLRQG